MNQRALSKHFESYQISEKDLIPVSTFTKIGAHKVACNEHLIVYTTSKTACIRVVDQKTSANFIFNTKVHGTITDLRLIINPSQPSTSQLLVGSRISGIFTFWSLSNATTSTPAILVYRLRDVSENIKYDFYYKKDVIFFAAAVSTVISVTKLFQVPFALHEEKQEDGSSIRTDLMNSESFTQISGAKLSVPSQVSDIKSFAFASDTATVACIESFESSSDGFRIYESTVPLSTLSSKKVSTLSLKYSIPSPKTFSKTASAARSVTLPTNPTENSGSYQYFLAGFGNVLRICPSSDNNTDPIDITLPKDFQVGTILTERIDDISVVMLLNDKKTRFIFVVLRRLGLSSDISKIDVSVKIVNFPENYEILDCSILKSMEIGKFTDNYVVDIYVYHSLGIAIAPVPLGNRLNYLEDENLQKSAMDIENNQESGTDSDDSSLSVHTLKDCWKRCVDDYAFNYDISKHEQDLIHHFLSHSNLIGSITKHAELEVLKQILKPEAATAVARFGKLQERGVVTEEQAEQLIAQMEFGGDDANNDGSESFQSVTVANPKYQMISVIKNIFTKSFNEATEQAGDSRLSHTKDVDEETEIDKDTEHVESTHILPTLFDSLEEASSSEPNVVTSPRQFPSDFSQSIRRNTSLNITPSSLSYNSAFVVSPPGLGVHTSPPSNSQPHSQMPLGTGLGYLSASHNSSPIVNNGNSMHSVVPGTTLGGGKTYSQIWGAPNLSSPHMAGLSTLSEGSPSQATWTSSTPTKSQLLVSPSQYSQTPSVSQLPNISQLSLHQSSIQHQAPYSQLPAPAGYQSSPLYGATSQTTRMPSITDMLGISASNKTTITDALQSPKDTPEPPFLLVKKPSSSSLSDLEHYVVKCLLLNEPMKAFGTIRTGLPSSAGYSKQSPQQADLGNILSCYAYVVLASPTGPDGKFSFEVSDYINGSGSEIPFLVSVQGSQFSVTKEKAKEVLSTLFGSNPNFLLLLGYVVYLVNPVLNSQEPSSSTWQPESGLAVVGPAQRLKWAITFASFVIDLLMKSPNAVETHDSEAVLKQWSDNQILISTTLGRIKKDAGEFGQTLLKIVQNESQKILLAEKIDELLKLLTRLLESW